MKITKKRVLALALCLTLIVSCVGLVHADNSGKKSTDAAEATAETTVETTAETALPSERRSDGETVYVLTDAAGSVEKIIVSGQSREADGEAQAAQTQEQKELPVDVRISYRLNGRKIAPEELAGKSGRVEIRIDYTNNARAVKEIGGKEETLSVPFLMLSAMLLDNAHFSDVRVENGRLVNDGTRTVVVGCALPGMSRSLALPEELDLTIPDHVTVSAEAKDFVLGSVYTLAANNLFEAYDENDPDALQKLVSSVNELSDAMDQLLDGAQALNGGLDTLAAKSGELKNGVGTLCDGADQLANGAGALTKGAEKLASGAKELNGGAAQLASGAGSLSSGAEELANGAAQLNTGLDQLSANSAAINDGAKTVFESLLSAAETQLKANGLSVAALTISNYQTQLEQIIVALDPDAVYAQALAQVTAAVEAKRPEIEALVTAAVQEQVTAAVTAAVRQNVSEQVNAAVAAQVRAQVILAATGLSVEEYEAAVANGLIDESVQTAIEAQIAAQLASSAVQAQIEAAIEAKMASEEIRALIAQNVEAQMASEEIRSAVAERVEAQIRKAIADAMAGPEVQGKLAAAAEGAQSVIALKSSLDQYDAFYLGLLSYTAGVDAAARGAQALSSGAAELKRGAARLADGSAALADGTGTLSDGAGALSNGASALSKGAGRLAAGAHTMQDSLPALIKGVEKLRDGSDALRSGMERFNEDGIQRLSRLVTEDAEGLAERLKALASLGKEYRSAYTGLSDDADGTLRFIYRSAAVGE